MYENINKATYPVNAYITTLVDMLDQLFVNPTIRRYGKNLALKYWSDMQAPDVQPHDAFRHILVKLKYSKWFDVFQIEQDEKELRIILKQVFEIESAKCRHDFITGFIDELTHNAYPIIRPAKVDKYNYNTYKFIFQKKFN